MDDRQKWRGFTVFCTVRNTVGDAGFTVAGTVITVGWGRHFARLGAAKCLGALLGEGLKT